MIHFIHSSDQKIVKHHATSPRFNSCSQYFFGSSKVDKSVKFGLSTKGKFANLENDIKNSLIFNSNLNIEFEVGSHAFPRVFGFEQYIISLFLNADDNDRDRVHGCFNRSRKSTEANINIVCNISGTEKVSDHCFAAHGHQHLLSGIHAGRLKIIYSCKQNEAQVILTNRECRIFIKPV